MNKADFPVAFIRSASVRDLERVSELLNQTWHATYDEIYGADRVNEITFQWHSVEALQASLNKPQSEFIVADTGKAILGMAYASQTGKTVKLHQLYVLPEAQGRNIGTDLLQEIVFCFDGAEEITLEVEPENTGAVKFYTQFGFEKSGETENCGQKDSAIAADVYSMRL